MKKVLLLTAAFALSMVMMTACGSEKSSQDDEAIESLYSYFTCLAEIPRPTYSEQQVSDYLKDWAEERGYDVTQDEYNNIIFDVPATEGKEDFPIVAFQAHMDMVAIAEDGYEYNPEKDPITVKRDGDTITAEHTSLGADDGIGIAIIQYIIENNENHGPLRVIITTDEESTQTGAINIDESVLDDIRYMINVDGEESDTITISSASNIDINITKNPMTEEPTYDTAVEVAVTGSKGGHSGQDINDNRMNSIIELFGLLGEIRDEDIDFQLVRAEGGDAPNAIPTHAKAVILCDSSDMEKIEKLAATYSEKLTEEYGEKNPEATAEVKKCREKPEVAMTAEARNNLIDFANNVSNGVYTMSEKQKDFVESSSNLGVLRADSEECELEIAARSSEEKPEKELVDSIKEECAENGLSCVTARVCAAWPIREDSRLTELAKEKYTEQNGEEPKVLPIHAGLECGWFAETNPDMDIISIGPDVVDVHSPDETCDIGSAVITLNMIEAVLAEIGEN